MSKRTGEGRCALTFGYDLSLISTRQRLLEKTGCRSLVASTMQGLRQALVDNAVDLVVVCQTVDAEECEVVAKLINQQAPEAGMLIMFNRHDHCHPDVPAESFVLLDSMSGPGTFVRTAEKMLAESGARTEALPA